MPIKWDAELDSILLHGVFEECNISFSKALCNKLAQRISSTGIECTAKAVENRLYTWKKKNVGGTTSTTGTPVKKVATTPKGTPRVKAGAAKPKKIATPPSASDSEENHPEGLQDEKEKADTPSMARGKRTLSTPKRSYAQSDHSSGDSDVEDEYVPMAKRVRTEPVDEETSLFGGGAIHADDGLDEI